MEECIKDVGLDVYKPTTAVAIAQASSTEALYFGEIPNTSDQITRSSRKLGGSGIDLSVFYEPWSSTRSGYRVPSKRRCEISCEAALT